MKSGRVGRRNIHSGRTGNADRTVPSSQYLVASTQLPVSSQFPVKAGAHEAEGCFGILTSILD